MVICCGAKPAAAAATTFIGRARRGYKTGKYRPVAPTGKTQIGAHRGLCIGNKRRHGRGHFVRRRLGRSFCIARRLRLLLSICGRRGCENQQYATRQSEKTCMIVHGSNLSQIDCGE
jgi:hypothetical protein